MVEKNNFYLNSYFSSCNLQSAVVAVIGIVMMVLTFIGAGASLKIAAGLNSKPVYADGRQIGSVHLFPLTRSGGLRIYFEPIENDLSLISDNGLSWWQAVNRADRDGYPRIDMQSGKNKLPHPYGDDFDPAYYTHDERNDERMQNKIFQGGRYWLLDTPDVEDGARFEVWLVRQKNLTVERLAMIEWGFDAKNSEITTYHHPQFVSESNYPVSELLKQSGFGDHWTEVSAEVPIDESTNN